MGNEVRIVKSTTEKCDHADVNCLTLYFEGAPTTKQIIHTAKYVQIGHRLKTNLKSRSLRIFTTSSGGLVRVQLVD